jgi:transposase
MKQSHKSSLSRKDKERIRLKAGRMFSKGRTQADVARKFNVSTAAANQWHKIWKKQGADGLKSAGKPGVKPKLSDKKRQAFKKAILKGPRAFGYETDLWTLSRLTAVMKKVAKIKLRSTRTWQIVRDLGFSPQKPQVKALQRDEKAIKEWKEKTLPDLKKMGKRKRLLPGF